jgi:WD40 repeat protein
VFDLETQQLVLTIDHLSLSFLLVWAFEPDCREIACGLADGTIVFHELPGGHELRRWAPPAHARIGAMAYSPDGSRLATVPAYSRSVFIRERLSGHVVVELTHPDGVFHVAWNPRRPNLLAAACEDYAIYIWDVETRSRRNALKGDTYNGMVLAYHPGGELLASRSTALLTTPRPYRPWKPA